MSESPRSVLVDPTPDGTLYPQYRSIFHMLLGRCRWMGGHKNGFDERRFDEAFREFDLARAGIAGNNQLILALIELYVVEACLARTRIELHPDCFGQKSKECHLGLASAKFETARGALQRAHNYLMSTHRNVIWWKLYYQLVSQYHADRLLLGYLRLASRPSLDRRDWERVTQSLRRLRRAYQGLRAALNYYLPGAGHPQPRRWLMRTWWEMTLCSYATGSLVLFNKVGNGTSGEVLQPYILHQLEELNASAQLLGEQSPFRQAMNQLKNELPGMKFADKGDKLFPSKSDEYWRTDEHGVRRRLEFLKTADKYALSSAKQLAPHSSQSGHEPVAQQGATRRDTSHVDERRRHKTQSSRQKRRPRGLGG